MDLATQTITYKAGPRQRVYIYCRRELGEQIKDFSLSLFSNGLLQDKKSSPVTLQQVAYPSKGSLHVCAGSFSASVVHVVHVSPQANFRSS